MDGKLLSQTALLFVIAGITWGCGKSFKSDAESAHGSVKMQIIAPGSVSETNESIPYQLSIAELLDISDLVSVSGKYAQFYIKASKGEKGIQGTQPKGQFLKGKDGVFVAKNFLSLQIATLYFHSQNLIRLENDLDFEEKKVNPLKIVLDTPVTNIKQSENNAFFDSDLDSIIYLKYSEGNLPLSLNGGVFAHEYFHSIFDRLVLKKIKSNSVFNFPVAINKLVLGRYLEDVKKFDLSARASEVTKKLSTSTMSISEENVKWYYALLLKGLNEGLADYWGWAYVNDPSFIAHSLPQTRTTRKLELNAQKIDNVQLLSDAEMLSIVFQVTESKAEKMELINAFSYLLGSRVALFFKSYSDLLKRERSLSDEAAKKKINQMVIDFSKSLATSLTDVKVVSDYTQLATSYSLLYSFMAPNFMKTENECQFLKTFFENDVQKSNKLQCVTTDISSAGTFYSLTTKDSQ